jgi:hypothetical protein
VTRRIGHVFGWRPLREYLTAVVAAYQSFVLGLVFGFAGAIGLFVSDQSGVRIAALIGVALGFLVAPYKAFQRMRWERDAARADSPFDRLAVQLGHVNALSGGGWAIDSFAAPNLPGLVARAIAASTYPLARGTEISSVDLDRFRQAAACSPLAHWFACHFPTPGSDESNEWKLAAPCNGFEFTVERNGFVSGGSEVSARLRLLLPRGLHGQMPKLRFDLLAQDLPAEPLEGGAQPDMFRRFELAGDPFRPDLPELVEMLDALAATLTTLARPVLEPIIHLPWQERLRERFGRDLSLVVPNFHVRSKPRTLLDALRLPEFPFFEGGDSQAELMIQTPPSISAYDRDGRLMLIRRELRKLLRTLQYRDFEGYIDGLGTQARTHELAGTGQPLPLGR